MTQNMTNFNFGDVVLLPFPFTNQTNTKQRPAVIISSQIYNITRPDVVVMAITSKQKQDADPLTLKLKNWEIAGLLKQSCIKPVMATIEKNIIVKKLGHLPPEDLQPLEHLIQKVLGNANWSLVPTVSVGMQLHNAPAFCLEPFVLFPSNI